MSYVMTMVLLTIWKYDILISFHPLTSRLEPSPSYRSMSKNISLASCSSCHEEEMFSFHPQEKISRSFSAGHCPYRRHCSSAAWSINWPARCIHCLVISRVLICIMLRAAERPIKIGTRSERAIDPVLARNSVTDLRSEG